MLLGDKADMAEIRAAISPTQADKLSLAYAGVVAEAATMIDHGEDATKAMFAQIGAFVALVGGGWPPEHRQEFIDQAAVDFADIPLSLLEPTLVEARRKVRWPREFVPWVHDAVAKRWEALKIERGQLGQLVEIVKGTAQ